MDITIKNIRGVAVTNILLLGLVGCSSTPAPWTQKDESPWGAKHEAESQAAVDLAVSDGTLNDPVLLADPEPEPIMMEAPESAPAPEVIIPVVVEEQPMMVDSQPVSQDIMSMLSSNYAVQVYAGATVDSVEKFKASKGLEDLIMVKTDRSGSIVYVLVDVHPDKASATAAAAVLENKIGSKPWVRSLAGLQNIVAQ